MRERGDHKIYAKIGARRPIPIAGKMSREMPPREYYSILREAGIDW